MRTFIITTLLWVVASNWLCAQNVIGQFSNYNIKNGLSQSSVLQVFQDKKGFIWLGTSDGLNRFDGRNFIVYKYKHNNTNSLSDSWILRIIDEDSENNLWVVTSDFSINKINLSSNKIVRFLTSSKDSTTLLPYQQIFSFVEDSFKNIWFTTNTGIYTISNQKNQIRNYNKLLEGVEPNSKNRIWAFTDNFKNLWIGFSGDLYRYNYAKQNFVKYSSKGTGFKGLSSGRVITPVKTSEKEFWILTSQGLCAYNPKLDEFKLFPYSVSQINKENIKITSILYDKSGRIWIGTTEGLIQFTIKTGQYLIFKNDPKNKKSISNNFITRIIEGNNKELWVGTMDGLNRLNFKDNTCITFKHENKHDENYISDIYLLKNGEVWIFRVQDFDNNGFLSKVNFTNGCLERIVADPCNLNSIPTTLVFSPRQDKSGNLWMGTFGNGVIKYSPRKSLFKHFPNITGKSSGSSSIWGFCEDNAGKIWVSAYEQGFAMFDTLNLSFIPYKPDITFSGSKINYNVMSICPDKNGYLWIATMGAGLLKFNPKKGKVESIYAEGCNKYPISSNFIRILTQSHSGKIFVIHTNQGIDILDPLTGAIVDKIQHRPENKNSLPSNNVWYVLEDSRGNLWISMNGYISFYDKTSKKFTNYVTGVKSTNGFPADKALCILESSKGEIWFGTSGGGICKFDPKSNKFITFSEDEGLVNGVVYGITEDTDGYFWLSTNKGLSRFDPKYQTFKNFDESMGLQSNEFNAGAFYKSKTNKMYFGGINGFNLFNPKCLKADTISVPTVLTAFHISNKPISILEPSQMEKMKINNNEKLIWDNSAYFLPMNITYAKKLIIPYKVKVFTIEFASLLFNSSEKNSYRYKMVGFDEDWNYPGSRNFATYTNLPHGKYIFMVQSSNADGIWSKKTAEIQIVIVPPFWKTFWFLTLLIILTIALIWLYIVNREKNLRKSKALLEEKVHQRTKLIEEKNEELNLRNIEISKQKEEIAFQARQLKSELVHHNQASEIALLRSQINPHFLFNTLNNIYSLVYQKSDDAPVAVMKLSEIMRYMLYDANSDMVPLEKEINYLKSFIELQTLRLKNRDCVEFSISGNIFGKIIAPMLFIPFVENAFKHGNKKSENPCIIINLNVNGHHILFTIKNQFQISDNIQKDQTGGIGLANVKRRLELIHPSSHHLEINKSDGKFEVTLELTLHEN